MPRLVVQPGTPQVWEIQLRPGINFLGRGASNDFRFDDPSISGAHCQLIVDGNAVTIRDVGSTNGTFVNRARIQEARLSTGQPLRLGSVDMIFYGDDPAVPKPVPPGLVAEAAIPALKVAPVPSPAPIITISDTPPAPEPPKPAGLKISGLHAPAPTPTAAAAELQTELISAPPIAAVEAGPMFCRFHPKAAARYLCNKCHRAYCEVCVTTLNVAGKTKINCRHCAVECVPLRVHLVGSNVPQNFFKTIPGSFAYPVRGSGIFILLVGMVVFAGIRLGNVMMLSGLGTFSVRNVAIGALLQALLGGYLFTLLQSMIHSTASGENEVPELAGINFLEDIILPFLRLLGLVLVCFAPAIALVIVTLVTASKGAAIAILPATLFGCVYFPMAFLAVAILDTVGAVNPLAIIPSILKVPLEYVITVVILAVVLIFTKVGDILLGLAFPKGLMTESIPQLLAMFGLKFFWSLVGVYLLIVNTRILGMLYLSKKDKLGWIGR